jgi:hypoxanthine phosphoribosyltransferase
MTTTVETQRTITFYPPPGNPNGDTEPLTFEEFIPEDVVYERLAPIAHLVGGLIAANPGNTIVSPIMSGATQTMDETLAIASHAYPGIDPEIKPMKLKRYHGTSAGSNLTVQQDLPDDGSVEGKVVILFDEVVDEAVAAKYAVERARTLGAKLIVFVTLTDKAEAHKTNIEELVDHYIVGFSVPNDFLLGWGMDWYGMGRWLRWIGRKTDGNKSTYSIPTLPALEDLLK